MDIKINKETLKKYEDEMMQMYRKYKEKINKKDVEKQTKRLKF